MEVELRWPPLSGRLVLWEVYIHRTGFSRDTQTLDDERVLDMPASLSHTQHTEQESRHCWSIIHCPYVPHVHIIYIFKVVVG